MTRDQFNEVFKEEYYLLTDCDIQNNELIDFYSEAIETEEEVKQLARDLVNEINSDMAELKAAFDSDENQSPDYDNF